MNTRILGLCAVYLSKEIFSIQDQPRRHSNVKLPFSYQTAAYLQKFNLSHLKKSYNYYTICQNLVVLEIPSCRKIDPLSHLFALNS